MVIMKNHKWFVFFFGVWLVLNFMAAGHLLGEDGSDDDVGIKKYGVVHNIAEDRKVEKVGGIYEPESLDKYLKRRLDDVNGRVNELSGKMDLLNQKIDSLIANQKDSSKE